VLFMTRTNRSDVRESLVHGGLDQERFDTKGQFSGCMRFIRQWEGQGMNGDVAVD